MGAHQAGYKLMLRANSKLISAHGAAAQLLSVSIAGCNNSELRSTGHIDLHFVITNGPS
jgi:hypothetical protein